MVTGAAVVGGDVHLRDLFAAEPERGERLTHEACGLYLDYSKNRITDETLRLLLEPLFLAVPGTPTLALVKPQFQVGQGQVGKGGVVRDPELRRQAIAAVTEGAAKLGFALVDQADCVITGPKGNQETFIWLRRAAAEPAP